MPPLPGFDVFQGFIESIINQSRVLKLKDTSTTLKCFFYFRGYVAAFHMTSFAMLLCRSNGALSGTRTHKVLLSLLFEAILDKGHALLPWITSA